MKKAVIDIGTNTFHLIIAEISDNRINRIIFRESRYIRIAKDGYNPISEASIQRGLECLTDYMVLIEAHESPPVEIIATQALRSASNQTDILQRMQEVTGITVTIISGEQEAKLVYNGCLAAIPTLSNDFLIIDIGGGSVEFILANNTGIQFLSSIKIGVQYLYSMFNPSDPITDADIQAIYQYIESQSPHLQSFLDQHKPKVIIGTSGSFEILANLVNAEFINNKYANIPVNDFYHCFQQMIHTTLSERMASPLINPTRAELLICGLLVMKYWIDKLQPAQLLVSSYALREGALID
jgi:exopolyphosphatase/guanosine-5'-triphosphate,3'-diphosphate pyrophosphatase